MLFLRFNAIGPDDFWWCRWWNFDWLRKVVGKLKILRGDGEKWTIVQLLDLLLGVML